MKLREKYGPLRKIVGYAENPALNGVYNYEILECGHRVKIKTDIHGETNAYRRRCRYCRDLEKANDEHDPKH